MRESLVQFHGTFSRPSEVLSSVLQGIYPLVLFFSIFINDLCNLIQYFKYLLFADDIKISHRKLY